MVLKFLLEKEFKQFFRNPFMPKLAVIFPLMVMLVMPWAATLDIKNIKVSIVDNDRSTMSGDLIEAINNSTYFDVVSFEPGYARSLEEVEYGRADLILEIPAGFENDLVNFSAAPVHVSINAVNSVKGMQGQSYITSLIMEFSKGLEPVRGVAEGAIEPAVDVIVKNMYNPTLNYRFTMIPGLIMVIMIVLCGFLPAVNIVQEKELGTIEQINVSPIGKSTFILAKLIPFWIIGFVTLSLAFFLAWLIYGLAAAGSYGTLYLFCGLFIFTVTGAGLVVSNYSSSMQQATFVMFFFVIICILMSGLLTPVSSMPGWAKAIAGITPTKYMVDALRGVFLRGDTLADLRLEFAALASMMAAFNTWAVLSYKKSK